MLTRPMMSTTMEELRRIPAFGMQMGYYQGHAGRIHHSWEDPSPVLFDMTNPDHLRRGFAEFDVAASLDADFIGFDAITELPLWDALRWTEMLKARSSRPVRFLGELSPSDLWLREHASFVFRSQIYGPDLLADFFLPGHEIWSGIRYDVLYPGQNPVPEAIILQEMRDVAHEGRVPLPLSFAQLPNPSEFNAARSWEYSVPEELQDPCYPLEHP